MGGRRNSKRAKNADCDADAKASNALLAKEKSKSKATTTTAKSVGIAEEMEKGMLKEEVARIESMIIGLETAVCAIHEGQGAANERQYEELPSSLTSSLMFNTNELTKAKLQIAEHLTKSRESSNVHFAQPLMHSHSEQNNDENEDGNVQKEKENCENEDVHTSSAPIRPIPVCLSCQRCSRTILICHHAV